MGKLLKQRQLPSVNIRGVKIKLNKYWKSFLSETYIEGFQDFCETKAQLKREMLKAVEKEIDKWLRKIKPGQGLGITFRVDVIQEDGEVLFAELSNRAERLTDEYIEWRQKVFERDNYTCQECGATGDLQAHHIKPVSQYPELIYDVDNGITLCKKCHAKKHPHLQIVSKGHSHTPEITIELEDG